LEIRNAIMMETGTSTSRPALFRTRTFFDVHDKPFRDVKRTAISGLKVAKKPVVPHGKTTKRCCSNIPTLGFAFDEVDEFNFCHIKHMGINIPIGQGTIIALHLLTSSCKIDTL
jgi:hypothetical protein